jgi:plastocyanin
MIDWQYQLQKKLQLKGNENNSTSTSTIDIPLGATATNNGQFYTPENATLPANSKVIWNNKDSVIHTATADDHPFDTNIINPGKSFSPIILSSSVGAHITYHCSIHPWG